MNAGTAYFERNGNVLVDLDSGCYNSAAPNMGAFESNFSGGSNQPPVAVISANPENGNAPLAVQFNSDGSSDPDGAISTCAWDFGDGGTSSEANPSHIYTNAGTYDVGLTVTDDQGVTGNATITVNVAQASQNELHVQMQSVSREQINKRFWQGPDTVLITDQNNQPVEGVTVTLYSDRDRRPQTSWPFDVVDVAKANYSYNASANIVTMQCE